MVVFDKSVCTVLYLFKMFSLGSGVWIRYRRGIFKVLVGLACHRQFHLHQVYMGRDTCKTFGLNINTKNDEVLYQPNSTRTREDDSMVVGNKLNFVLEFTYLRNTISSNGCIDDEIQRRMAKAYAFDHEENLDEQSNKQGNTWMDRAAIYERSPDQKEFPVDWPHHEDVTREATKADYLISTVLLSQKERTPSSPVQGYHQKTWSKET